jgi:hypothetical protein
MDKRYPDNRNPADCRPGASAAPKEIRGFAALGAVFRSSLFGGHAGVQSSDAFMECASRAGEERRDHSHPRADIDHDFARDRSVG